MLADTAFVFPGQGSQYPGMIRDLTACGPIARERLTIAEQVTGIDMTALMSTADAARIADPQIAQLLVFVASTVLLAELAEAGASPDVVAGHSLGEYTALVACGSLDWHSALALVAARAEAMAEAARWCPGTMGAVVGLAHEHVERLCSAASARHGTAVIANLNSARQVVVSGTVDAVSEVLAAAREAGALRARGIPVGSAYHSPLMADAQRRLAPLLRQAPLRAPRVPFVSGITGELVGDIEAYRLLLAEQITLPVRWHAVAQCLAGLGVTEFVEVGPGRVLTGLDRETVRTARHRGALDALRSLQGQVLATRGG